MPQFIGLHAPVWPQIVIIEATFVLLAPLNVFSYALLASRARRAICSLTVQRAVNCVGGTMLMGAGLLASEWKSASI